MQFLADMLDAPVDRPEHTRDDGAGRGLPRRLARRRLSGARRIRRTWRRRPPLRADNDRRRTRVALSRLARRGRGDVASTASERHEHRLSLRSCVCCDKLLALRRRRLQALAGLAARRCRGAAFSELHGREVRTVKQCPPFVDAMAHGFVMRLPCDVVVRDGVSPGTGIFRRSSVETQPRSPLSFHAPAQVAGTPFYRARRRR